jgi:uncharacterized protein YecE (DUF72 family)
VAIHVGTSGWSYDRWEGLLYPRRVSSLERFDYYAERFGTVEVNYSFYRWPKDETFSKWKQHAPAGFLFRVKARRGLTHLRKLDVPDEWLERMTAGLRCLGDRMGVWFFQLRPYCSVNVKRLDDFLARLPDEFKTAFEFRHPSWHCEEVFETLERHRAAYCVISGLKQPCHLRATAPFVYVRLHGPEDRRCHGSYTDDGLRWWRDRIREWADQRREVFAYFNNDVGGHAVRNAERLIDLLED